MEYQVSDVRQTASGGSYVVKYLAEVDTAPGDGIATVEVISTLPEDADPALLRDTVEFIDGQKSNVRGGRVPLHCVA